MKTNPLTGTGFNPAQALQQAFQHHTAGRLQEAEQLYRQILRHQPEHPDVLHGLGMIAYQRGRNDVAFELIQHAIVLKPSAAYFYNSLGNVFKAQGCLDDAIASFQRALAVMPDYAAAHNNLGIALKNQGRMDEAIGHYQRAVALKPDLAEAHNNLGIALKNQGRVDEAIVHYQKAVTLRPDLADAHNNLGIALKDRGRVDEAIQSFQRALALRPNFFEAHNNLGNALQYNKRLADAVASFLRALALRPDLAEAHSNLGLAFMDQGRLPEAVACFQKALTLKPDYAGAWNNLGVAFKDLGRFDEAVAALQRALILEPDFAKAHNNLGNALRGLGRLDEAVDSFNRALALRPDFAEAYTNLGNSFKDQGRLDEAVAAFRKALDSKPDHIVAYSNLVYTLDFHPGYKSRAIAEERRNWNRRYAEPLKTLIQPHGNDRGPERNLRIGYVSPDFRRHPVGRFLLPLIEHHDRESFALFAYSNVIRPDALTDRFRALMDTWRVTTGLSDAQVAKQIREDRIDILIDLTMHMAGNRLLVFARKPAPVQVTWLAYCGSTGLEVIDYRLSDPYLDSPDGPDPFYSEKTVCLPETYWCYQPTGQEPEVHSLPALERGMVTFGCLNNFAKVNEPTLAVWSRILQVVPQSRLVIHASEGKHRERLLQMMEQSGVSSQRIEFVGVLPMKAYFELYHGIDIALDTAPYNGGTTTCDALWMGVPVVSLAGDRAVGRSGLSILSNVGLSELVGRSAEEYVNITASLAGNPQRLAELRGTLRKRMQASPLMNAPRFARNMEASYSTMWRKWCEHSH